MTDSIIDPTRGRVAPSATGAPTAARPRSLEGLRVGLLENTKRNAAEFLDAVGLLLTAADDVGPLVRKTKLQFAMPLTDDVIDEIARECDVAVIGVGDCGSCSAAAVADGIALERAGVPVAVICTDAFVTTSQAMAELKGRPDFPFVLTQHPVANLDRAQIDARARALVDDVVSQLTAPGTAS